MIRIIKAHAEIQTVDQYQAAVQAEIADVERELREVYTMKHLNPQFVIIHLAARVVALRRQQS